MGRTVSIGAQNFEQLRDWNCFLVDKTDFIRQWWETNDSVTLLCRPRRFGKTLTMSMLECFFDPRFAKRGEELFGDLNIWQHEAYQTLQGSVPVVFASFASCKGTSFSGVRTMMFAALTDACMQHSYLLDSPSVGQDLKDTLSSISRGMDDGTAAICLNVLCAALEQHWGVKPIVLLDEYDTPMQECWLAGWWDEAVALLRPLFNATFKTNTALERAIITGVTRVSRESIFSDLNNLEVVTTSISKYATCFGFTEEEVFAGMDEMGLSDRESVKFWYDGFIFGDVGDIYNPWSITNYLDKGQIRAYWANTSGNGLVSTLIQKSNIAFKEDFEELLRGGYVRQTFDEQVVFSELGHKPGAVWSLLLATGYLKAENVSILGATTADLRLTNHEVLECFDDMVVTWFGSQAESYSEFTQTLLSGDYDIANECLNDLLEACISSFDSGGRRGLRTAPENFYHGLVLGLLAELRGRYELTSNRESGFGRYDVMLFPLCDDDPAFVLEFKVFDPKRENTLEDTLKRAHTQMQEKAYATQLTERGIASDRIHEVAFAFQGKVALIG